MNILRKKGGTGARREKKIGEAEKEKERREDREIRSEKKWS